MRPAHTKVLEVVRVNSKGKPDTMLTFREALEPLKSGLRKQIGHEEPDDAWLLQAPPPRYEETIQT